MASILNIAMEQFHLALELERQRQYRNRVSRRHWEILQRMAGLDPKTALLFETRNNLVQIIQCMTRALPSTQLCEIVRLSPL